MKKIIRIIIGIVVILLIIVAGIVGRNQYVKIRNQKEQIAKVSDWFHAIDAESGKQKLVDISVDDDEKMVIVEYRLADTLEQSLTTINQMRIASDQYLSDHKEDKLNKSYKIGISFCGSYKYSTKAGLYNYDIDMAQKVSSSKLDILELDLNYAEVTDCSMFDGIKGLNLYSGEEKSYVEVVKQFPDLKNLLTDYILSKEEWQWCQENKISCKMKRQGIVKDDSYYRELYK